MLYQEQRQVSGFRQNECAHFGACFAHFGVFLALLRREYENTRKCAKMSPNMQKNSEMCQKRAELCKEQKPQKHKQKLCPTKR